MGNHTNLLLAAALAGDDAPLRFDIYQDTIREWRWRSWGGSRIVGMSSEGYVNRAHCVAMARKHGYRGD